MLTEPEEVSKILLDLVKMGRVREGAHHRGSAQLR
jgi:hypothetical protein